MTEKIIKRPPDSATPAGNTSVNHFYNTHCFFRKKPPSRPGKKTLDRKVKRRKICSRIKIIHVPLRRIPVVTGKFKAVTGKFKVITGRFKVITGDFKVITRSLKSPAETSK
ncbi:MAG: hypothetical protein LBH72_06725 [Proteiniphilum sp.]|jgi:hypothetical protein|nr:hypothetical protein [Proteiniphilum sp.]